MKNKEKETKTVKNVKEYKFKDTVKSIKWPSFKETMKKTGIVFGTASVLAWLLFGWSSLIELVVSKIVDLM